jgi:hypothetical protein
LQFPLGAGYSWSKYGLNLPPRKGYKKIKILSEYQVIVNIMFDCFTGRCLVLIVERYPAVSG